MKGKMKAALMPKIREMEIVEMDIPQIKPDEVLVKMKHIGICGSDVHYYEEGRIGDFIVKKPIILGHECAGEVVEVGQDVRHLKAGDQVTIEPGKPCGKCSYCMSGNYNLCQDMIFMATPPVDGAMAEYVAYPEHLCYKLPAHLDTIDGCLVDPIAVAYHAVLQADTKVGQSAVVLGAGTIGLSTMMALKSVGAYPIFCTDVVQQKLDMAKRLGATETYLANQEDYCNQMLKQLDGDGFDVVIETAGSAKAILQSTQLVRPGGTIVLVGMTANSINDFDTACLIAKEAKLHTVFRYRNLWPTAINAIASGSFPVKSLVSDYYPFDQSKQAFERCVNDKENVIKIVLQFD